MAVFRRLFSFENCSAVLVVVFGIVECCCVSWFCSTRVSFLRSLRFLGLCTFVVDCGGGQCFRWRVLDCI